MEDINIKKINSTILITLTREKVLNALNLNMVREIFKNIGVWDKDNDISGIIIQGSGEKSFCAGGDIVRVYHSKNEPNSNLSNDFFREEYILNLSIANFSKPWISLLNGIAMGGGLGLSVHGKYRIVNNKTVTAMPETAIGLFPDVGGGYFLSRMGNLGAYLALTGRVMNGLDSIYAGIGTHFIENENIDLIIKKIINLPNSLENIVIGRSDLASSMGIEDVNSKYIFEITSQIISKCKRNNIKATIGGNLTRDSYAFIKNFNLTELKAFESRKCTFSNSNDLSEELFNKLIQGGLEFELTWLDFKKSMYTDRSKEENIRISNIINRMNNK